MFGANEIVGKKYFTANPEAQAGKLLVTSLFVTLQGEGPYRGEPAVFIRLAKCNLACSFCDTYFDDGTWMAIDEIAQRVDDEIVKFFSDDPVPAWARHDIGQAFNQEDPPTLEQMGRSMRAVRFGNTWMTTGVKRNMVLVITGGEPTLQANLKPLLEWGETQFTKTQIESNGLLVGGETVPTSTTVVVSPKCSEKLTEVTVMVPNVLIDWWGFKFIWGNKPVVKQEMRAVAYLKPKPEMLARADCLKFVMEAGSLTEDMADYGLADSPYSSVPDWALEWAEQTGKPVFISPMNVYRQEPQKAKDLRARNTQTTVEERSMYDEVVSFWEEGLLDMRANQRNHEWAARYAIRHGFIFNVQIHLLASVA